jgi:hypothetical protein
VRFAEGEEDLFFEGHPVRAQALLLWHFAMAQGEPPATSVALAVGVSPLLVRTCFRRYRQLLAAHQEVCNNQTQLGGWDVPRNQPMEVEMDEVLLRTRAVLARGNQVLIRTWRYLGILQRGSVKRLA